MLQACFSVQSQRDLVRAQHQEANLSKHLMKCSKLPKSRQLHAWHDALLSACNRPLLHNSAPQLLTSPRGFKSREDLVTPHLTLDCSAHEQSSGY
jgi:hypothetical protein